MGAEFVQIFTEMSLVPIITLIAGFILLFTEMFMPGFGVCGIIGSVSILFGVIWRIAEGASFFQSAVLVAIVLVLAVVIFLVVVRSADKGLISKTPFIQSKTAIPKDFGQKQFQDLVGKTGVITTQCKPVGKATIEGNSYEVMAKEGFLIKGVNIQVVEVSGDEIWVEKVKEIKEK